jgi:hypothetical protein
MKTIQNNIILLLVLLALIPVYAHGDAEKDLDNTTADAFLETGTFVIRTNRDYRYITIKDGSLTPGNIAVIQGYVNNFQVQGWKFVPATGGYYRIKSPSGVCLSQKRIIALTVEPEANEDSQLWRVIENTDGFYTIVSKTGKYLTYNMPQLKDKQSLAFANAADNSVKQQWHLIKMTDDERKVTSFTPEVHGFKFANTFTGVDASYRYGGLCGGMVYSSMDYFRARKPIPNQNYRPANRTPLQSFIYGRQNDAAMVNQLDKWTELRINPFGWRDFEFYEWGLKGTGGGRIEELQGLINGLNPAPLGLYEGGTMSYAGYKYGDHQVLAVGYSLGRYKGDLGKNKQDFKILIYDPNHPLVTRTLVPDVSRACYFYVESGDTWRTYFVDRKYSPKTPPDVNALAANEPNGSIRNIYVTFKTGGDDLRGGNDNVNVTVNYRDGTTQTFNNVNAGARWVDKYEETVHLVLNKPVSKTDIISFTLTTTFGGGFDGDNWNLDWFHVGNGGNIEIVCANCQRDAPLPLVRFTGDRKTFTIPVR